jgi:DNA-binding response OmpR family regulator
VNSIVLRGNVLVVDDDQAIRQRLTRLLRDAGCVVTTAQDGTEALDALARLPFSLVFLDDGMPGRDGLRTLRDIRDQFPELPVIMLAGFATLREAQACIDLGVAGYINKKEAGLSDQDLLERAQRLLERQERDHDVRELILQANRATATALQLLNRETLTSHNGAQERYLHARDLLIDVASRRVFRGNTEVPLTKSSYEFLYTLARHAPSPVGYDTLLTEALGYVKETNARELCKYHIHELRLRVEPDLTHPVYILSHRQVGYSLDTTTGLPPAADLLQNGGADDLPGAAPAAPAPSGDISEPGQEATDRTEGDLPPDDWLNQMADL